MTSPASASCSVVGAQYLLVAGADEDTICTRFQDSFYAALDADEAYDIAIEVTKGGTITARISPAKNAQDTAISEISVDVMDRALDYRDVMRLAEASAAKIKQDRNGA